ncbi:MAG: hypothetical protein GF364_21190 [Candidatus Lokiarchaeota archaeon]|nr:hypothetical protein [Candidatus Lokiarchaeota archaeon]
MIHIQFIIVIIVHAVVIGLYLVFKMLMKKQDNKARRMLIGYVLFILCTGILLIISFLLLYTRPLISGVFKMLAWASSVTSLFFLNQFGRFIRKIKSNVRNKIARGIVFGCLPIMLLLPWNHWEYLTFYESGGLTLQPFSLLGVFALSIHIFIVNLKRSRRAIECILDPALAEIYKWVHKGLKAIVLSTPSLFGNIIYYFTPPSFQPLVTILLIGLFFVASIGVIFSMLGIYLALAFPETLLKRVYMRYKPMWKTDYSDEDLERQIDKLKDALF